MQAARDLADFLRRPVGRYAAGRCYVVWAQTASRVGAAFFGRFDPDDRAALEACFDFQRSRGLRAPLDVVFDGSALLAMDPGAFDVFSRFVEARWSELLDRCGRLVVMRPPGLPGATVSGLFYELCRGAPAALFTDRREGLQWLGVSAAELAELVELLQALDGSSPVVRRLRHHLATDLRADVDSAARALGLSSRSLQRALRAAGTSFRNELDRARIRAAEALLVDTDDKLEAVAKAVGLSSRAAFSELFLRHAGEAPGEFRARRRVG